MVSKGRNAKKHLAIEILLLMADKPCTMTDAISILNNLQ
jgi:hypothetical protein